MKGLNIFLLIKVRINVCFRREAGSQRPGQVVTRSLSNRSLLALRPPAHFYATTTGGSQQLMRHFISESPIMAELQPRREVEPQLLNGGDLDAQREDADASESAKKKRRKKKRNKTSASGRKPLCAGKTADGGMEAAAQKQRKKIASSCATKA